ncbi:hypothetical protein GA0061071_106229 [Kosakonia oryzendophytica]|uniref:Lipoprotein n=1 Tax=Kosakonia oryzendophytica TaxID=1005665 RepID=A0A1C4C3S2_9ENTR|nr:hypothetical protein [Kosakonia oryzendophytica]AMO46764.1 Lipoprotein [Enterobacter sp. FY-07]TDT51503.1 hypothetical protein DFO53_4006 [Enterobacter sp. AG5470]WBT58531.1 hypothetical protein O9K67_01660 [Kosakonia oryzendophytica]SCC13663.1 hypothetical protein GA0061071_106229 [Kosakonia oryzendophytica]
MKKIVQFLAVIAVAGALAGCARTAIVQNIDAPVSAGHTQSQVRAAILKAGQQRQWVMNDAGPGVITGRLDNRGHVAEIRITYAADSYSINYANSLNLKASDGRIHKKYNTWVNTLDKQIQQNLASGAAL